MINPCVWLVRKEDGRVTYTTDRQRADAWMRDARRKVTSLCRVQDAEAEAVVAAHAKRLALELECLLLDCKDTAAVSKWWDSAHEALDQYRADLDRLYPPPPTRMGEPVTTKEAA
jgi:hypothetical protein